MNFQNQGSLGDVLSLIAVLALPLLANAQSNDTGTRALSVAVLPFAADEKQYGELGRDLQSLLTAHLSAHANIIMVERADLDAALSESELGISGTVDPETAAKIGYITGAQVLLRVDLLACKKSSSPSRKLSEQRPLGCLVKRLRCRYVARPWRCRLN